MTRRLGLGAVVLAVTAGVALVASTAWPGFAGSRRAGDTDHGTVVLLHGLGRGPGSMAILADRIEDGGYRVVSIGYPSTEKPPEELVAHVKAEVAACCAAHAPLHFVTYSLGGLIVRALYTDAPPPGGGRVVMLGPPNAGSPLVDEFGGWPLFRWLGPTASALGTHDASFPNRLGPAPFEVGVIAGTRDNPVGAHVIAAPSDGTVPVASARLDGMRDFITVHHSHTFLMRSETVAAETLHFLEHGRFSEAATRPEASP